MKTFLVIYEHTEYGYYASEIEDKSISKALKFFKNNHLYNKIHGIIEKK